ncbi:DMT family transporter [Ruegeria sp. HKCCD8929]|uniref:DMT family transporter n=1 Tax=Ruegeria sp. HKCCD8929 TaxID=2683006 RepID=UPI001488BF89|nr:DMT family transporter [Ruegeria sp. HKCCD8929]
MDPKITLLWFAPTLCCALIPIHAGMNAKLSRAAGHPLWATLLSFGVSFVCLVAGLGWLRATLPNLSSLVSAPPWAWVGDANGVIYVMATIILIPCFGAAAFHADVVAGQMTMALIQDKNGLFGNAALHADFFRITGAVLSIAGDLIMQFGKAS